MKGKEERSLEGARLVSGYTNGRETRLVYYEWVGDDGLSRRLSLVSFSLSLLSHSRAGIVLSPLSCSSMYIFSAVPFSSKSFNVNVGFEEPFVVVVAIVSKLSVLILVLVLVLVL